MIKGHADRARAYCVPPYLDSEMKIIVDTFDDIGHNRKEIEAANGSETEDRRG